MTLSQPTVASIVRIVVGIVVLTLIIALSSCAGMTTPELAKAPLARAPNDAFVEAYLEFVGPPDRWAGPRTLTLHLLARESEDAQAILTPNPVKAFLPSTGEIKPSANPISGIVARTELDELGRAVLEQAVPFSGCLYPVRVKLIREDGSLVEREGCRANHGWPVAISHAVSDMIQIARSEQGQPRRQNSVAWDR
jgi:hypothetical protein